MLLIYRVRSLIYPYPNGNTESPRRDKGGFDRQMFYLYQVPPSTRSISPLEHARCYLYLYHPQG